MIASNFRKFPEAMALQLPLPFGRTLKWALARPGARMLRSIRAARAKLMADKALIQYPTKPIVPDWWRETTKAAKALALKVRDALIPIVWGI